MTNQTEIFFNTVNLSGDDLKQNKFKAGKQNSEILSYMIAHHTQEFTPWELFKIFNGKFLIGSIRRSLTTLTKQGWLKKSDVTVYIPETTSFNHKWKYQPKPVNNGKI